MDKFTIGEFHVEVGEPYPIQVVIRTKQGQIRFTHKSLADLEYAVQRAMRTIILQLSEDEKPEVRVPR